MLHNPSLAIIAVLFFLHSLRLWFRRTCVASLSGGFCASSERCQKGVSLARRRTIKRTHTHIEGHARGKCHRGGSHSAGKSFPLSFCLPSLPLYIIEKATQQGTLGGCPSSSCRGVLGGGGGGTKGWWGEEFPGRACKDRIWIKTHRSHHSFHHQRSELFFFFFFYYSRKSSLPWSDTSFTLVLAVKVKTVRCGWEAAHPESYLSMASTSGGGGYGYLLPGWDLLLNWLLAQKWRNWKDNLVMQVCR